jgi:prepilin-type N-terminal cleavage/methylation domain-containing protein
MQYHNFKKGMSLIEMMVAISIFSVCMLGFTLFFARNWKTNSFILEEGEAMLQATHTVNDIASELRSSRQSEAGSYMIATATDTELIIYVDDDFDGSVEKVRYYLDDGNNQFKKGVAEYSGGSYGSYTVTTLANYVMNESGTNPVFVYFDYENTELASSPTVTNIRVIEINLWVNIKPLSAPDNVRIGTSVELRNLDAS